MMDSSITNGQGKYNQLTQLHQANTIRMASLVPTADVICS